jgi:hypothetical protein
VRGGEDGGTDGAAGRLGAATVVPRHGSYRGDPMSFEDDEYWDSEYEDNPKRPYADTTATARDPYADAVAARWGADTRRPPAADTRRPPARAR